MIDLEKISMFTRTIMVDRTEALENSLYRPLEIAVNYCDDLVEELRSARAVVDAAKRLLAAYDAATKAGEAK